MDTPRLYSMAGLAVCLAMLAMPPDKAWSATHHEVALADSSNLPDANHFLWFTGHWDPRKKNVFVIDKGSGAYPAGGGAGSGDNTGGDGDGTTPGSSCSPGGSVTVNPDGSVTIQGPGIDAWNKRVDEAQKKADDWVNQLTDPAYNADLRTQHLSNLLLPDAQEQQQLWQGYKIDKQQDILSPDTKPAKGSDNAPPSKPAAPQRTLNDAANDFCTAVKPDYDQVVAYCKSIKHAKDADLNVPAPPEFEYDCYVCDSDRRKVYDTTITHYVRDFSHPEDSMIRKALGFMHDWMMINGEENIINPDLYQAFGKGGACYHLSYYEMAEAVQEIASHLFRRAEKLVKKYHKDWRAGEAICRTFLSIARDYALLTGNTTDGDAVLPELSPILGLAFDHYYQLLRKNDWKQVANIPYAFNLARTLSLLAGNSSALGDDYWRKLRTIMNGFQLTVDMDTKFGKDQGYWISHVRGQCLIGPDFQRDSNMCYKWVVLDENRINPADSMYETKALQEIDCKLLANQITGSQYSPVYVGTKKYTINLQGLRMDFCSPGQDTIILSRFYPQPKDSGWWKIPHAPLQNLGISGEQFFTDVKRQKQLVDNGEAQKASNNYQSQNEAMIARMKQMAEQMKSDTGRKTFQDYQKIMEMANQVKQSANNGILAKIMFMDFELPVQNNNAVLVDKKFDGRLINPQTAGAVVYAWFNIHIENDGNGPPKKQ